MPGAVGAGTFWTQTVDWVNSNGTNTDAVLKAIDASWPKLDVLAPRRGAPPTRGARPARCRGRTRWPSPRAPRNRGLSRFLVPVAGLIGFALCIAGILILLDHHGGQNLLASIYDALGNTSGATELRNGQGDQLLAKILLAVIALAVGVGGIWLLFIGVGALVGMLRPRWRDRILPWVFVGPALILLAVYLVYPARGDDRAQLLRQQAVRSRSTTTPS